MASEAARIEQLQAVSMNSKPLSVCTMEQLAITLIGLIVVGAKTNRTQSYTMLIATSACDTRYVDKFHTLEVLDRFAKSTGSYDGSEVPA